MYDNGDIENLKKYENINIKIFILFVSDPNLDDFNNFKRVNYNTEISYVKAQFPTLSDFPVVIGKYPLMWISWCKSALSMESKRNSYKTTYNGYLKRNGRYKWKKWMNIYKYVDDNQDKNLIVGLHELGIYKGDGQDHVDKFYEFIRKYESKYTSIKKDKQTRDVGTQTMEKMSVVDRNKEAQQRYREKNREKLRNNAKKYHKKKEPSELGEINEPAADSLADANAGGESGAENLGIGCDLLL